MNTMLKSSIIKPRPKESCEEAVVSHMQQVQFSITAVVSFLYSFSLYLIQVPCLVHHLRVGTHITTLQFIQPIPLLLPSIYPIAFMRPLFSQNLFNSSTTTHEHELLMNNYTLNTTMNHAPVAAALNVAVIKKFVEHMRMCSKEQQSLKSLPVNKAAPSPLNNAALPTMHQTPPNPIMAALVATIARVMTSDSTKPSSKPMHVSDM